MSVLSFEHVHVSQDGLPTLQDISMNLQAGDFVYLIGKTGSGKSTFLSRFLRNCQLMLDKLLCWVFLKPIKIGRYSLFAPEIGFCISRFSIAYGSGC